METVVTDIDADFGVASSITWGVTDDSLQSAGLQPYGGSGLTNIRLYELKLLQLPDDSRHYCVIYSTSTGLCCLFLLLHLLHILGFQRSKRSVNVASIEPHLLIHLQPGMLLM